MYEQDMQDVTRPFQIRAQPHRGQGSGLAGSFTREI
jgi:hypothetical protein